MTPRDVNPYGITDLKKFNDMLQSCADTECLLAKFEKMGIDVTQLREANNAHQQFAVNGKQQFFPSES